MIRRLDTTRPYGTVFPRINRLAFEQDYLGFDVDGFCIEDPPPTPPQEPTETHSGPAPDGAVSLCAPEVSAPQINEPAPRLNLGELKAQAVIVLSEKSAAAWTTVPWPKLRKGISRQFGVWPKDRDHANAILAKHGLITGA